MIDDRQETRRGDHFHFARPGRLAAAFRRADDAAPPARRRQCREQHAGNAGQRAVERHLAERHIAAEFVCRERPHPANRASAIGRSKWLPSFNTSAGARLTVIRLGGNPRPSEASAALTRSRDSATALSGKATTVKLTNIFWRYR
jgi:hypothetical protein